MIDESQESRGFKEVPATEILASIEKDKDVEYHHIIIKDEIDASGLKLKRTNVERTSFELDYLELPNELSIIDSNISFENSRFYGPIKFENIMFRQGIIFKNCQFYKYVHFKGSQFKAYADFSQTLFDSFTDFSGCNGGPIFSGSIFDDRVDFVGFSGSINFVGTKFNGIAYLFRSHFGSFTQFNGAKFSDVDFSNSRFDGVILFRRVYFFGNTAFFRSMFEDGVEFDGSEFREFVNFKDSKFAGHTSFDNCAFNKIANFGSASFEANSSCSFKYSSFNKLFIRWESIKNKLIYNDHTYLTLVQNYNNLGWFDDADACYYQYRTKRRKEHIQGLTWILDIIPWMFYGYSVRFYYPLAWMIGILIISAAIYVLGGQAQFPSAFGLSAIILTTTTQSNLTETCWIVSIMERIIGWLLMSTFLVALAKKTLR